MLIALSLLTACDLTAKKPATGGTDVEDTGCDSPSVWYADADGDGLGTTAYTTRACEQPAGYVPTAYDCDDADAGITTGPKWYRDGDGDSYGAGESKIACSVPDGFVADATDCDDLDAAIHPGGEEHCDGKDEDCDTVADNDAVDAIPVFTDVDLDGFGDPSAPTTACATSEGLVANDSDCDDTSADIAPGAPEHCDGIDEDCDSIADNDPVDPLTWYLDADNDSYGDPLVTLDRCEQPTQYVSNDDDCDDRTGVISPAASEVCGGVDENCNGTIDEDGASGSPVWYVDGDGDGYGDGAATASCTKPAGMVYVSGDCDDGDSSVNPGADEICGGGDENCDGSTDESTAIDADTWYADVDADGYGDAVSTARGCTAPAGYIADASDCDDADAAVSPDAAEVCADSIDNDCGGDVDEGCIYASCAETLAHGATTDGLYEIDPDGAGGAASYDAWCDMTTDGGGWTLVLDRTHINQCCVSPCASETGVVTTLSTGTITRTTTNTGMDETRFASLLSVSTEALAVAAETIATCQDSPFTFTTTLAALQSANCHAMGTDLSEVPLAWAEVDCTYTGGDYSLWFGSSGLTWMTTIYDAGLAWGGPYSGYHPGTAEMYVR